MPRNKMTLAALTQEVQREIDGIGGVRLNTTASTRVQQNLK